MILRMLTLLLLIAQLRLNTVDASDHDAEEKPLGGQGFANFIYLWVLVGVALLAIIVIIAVLALSGQFEQEFIDAPV